MRVGRWCLLWALALSAGCGPSVTTEEAAKRVLADDPAFRSTLEQKNTLDVEIAGLQRELFAKKSEVDLKLKALQQAYRDAKRESDARVKGLIAQLNPQREQVRLDMTLAENQLKAQQAEVSNLKRSVAQLRASLKTTGEAAPGKEARADRNARLDALASQLGERQAQVKELQDHLQLLRLKLQLLRQ